MWKVNVQPLGPPSWIFYTADFRGIHTSTQCLKNWSKDDEIFKTVSLTGPSCFCFFVELISTPGPSSWPIPHLYPTFIPSVPMPDLFLSSIPDLYSPLRYPVFILSVSALRVFLIYTRFVYSINTRSKNPPSIPGVDVAGRWCCVNFSAGASY